LILTVERFPVDPEFEKADQEFKVLRSAFVRSSGFGVDGERGTWNERRTMNSELRTCVASESAV